MIDIAPPEASTWSPEDLAELAELMLENARLPEDRPRALLSIRLSILTDTTTSPERQELDLWRHANRERKRVVGVARDLGTSATKKAPWERIQLGKWLTDRIPEFDELIFWKLDRFVRKITDLHEMIKWCQKYEKNIVSLNDPIDLTSPMGQAMVTLTAAVAEIEVANTGIRVASMWEKAKAGDKWLVGAPPYGYKVHRKSNTLTIDPKQYQALRWMLEALRRGRTGAFMAKVLTRAKVQTSKGGKWTGTYIMILLRNPALQGYRVEVTEKNKPPVLVMDKNAQPIRVAEPIFTDEEFSEIQKILAHRAGKRKPMSAKQHVTHFLGVLIHATCGSNVTSHRKLAKGKEYFYLRCKACNKATGIRSHDAYNALHQAVLKKMGDLPVEHREYARGAEIRAKVQHLEESIAYYMKGLAPGGNFTRNAFAKETAELALERLMAEIDEIDPDSTKDRWIRKRTGQTYRELWENGSMEKITEDLLRAGVRFAVDKIDGTPTGQLLIPDGVEDRLLLKENDFALTL